MSQKIYSGYNAYLKLHDVLKEYSPQRIFLVTGRNLYTQSGAEGLLSEIINEYDYVMFHDFDSNPKLKDIKNGVNLFNNEKCDFVLSVGGGSAIDMAKTISLLATQSGDLEDYVKGVVLAHARTIPSVVMPTTAGTGSESTHFSVAYIQKVKYSMAHDSMLPDVAILEPAFTKSLPPYITACSGMDALCQGIESLWSVKSTGSSREFSRRAIKLALANIVTAVNNPDKKARENMLIASNWAGRAINVSLTTVAHAVSYPLTSYFGIPHGHAVALTLPYFIEFNAEVTNHSLQDGRGLQFVCDRMNELFELLDVHTSQEARKKVLGISRRINLETRLSNLGIREEGVEIVIKNGFDPKRVINNPKLVTEEDLRSLLEMIR